MKRIHSDLIKFILISILFLCLGCYTIVNLPKTKIHETSDRSQNIKTKEYIKINNITFEKRIIHLKQNYNFGDGVYFEYDFNLHEIDWLGIKLEIDRLLVYDYKVTDFWFRGGSNCCISPGIKTAFQMIIKPKFIVKFAEIPEGIEKYNFKRTRPRIHCGLSIVHYLKN